MNPIANTPKPPYYAVIFTSTRTKGDLGYDQAANRMVELAQGQSGFLGIESARDEGPLGIGITVSYWSDLDAIKQWKADVEHLQAQRLGRETWYQSFKVRICKVEREYGVA
ncbi:MAG TPA: antibiotic biosynthesis monooxygenase [Oceanospirillaceae bacterium]|mgnify:CR=1 FL=1|nr:antibiotic biosynthesis monooxygenase [Oceanospirillaceae bacterium]